MGWNLKDWRSYGGWVRDMEIVPCLDENNLVVGATREEYVTGFPWKNESFGFEERVVVAMAAIVFGLREKVSRKSWDFKMLLIGERSGVL